MKTKKGKIWFLNKLVSLIERETRKKRRKRIISNRNHILRRTNHRTTSKFFRFIEANGSDRISTTSLLRTFLSMHMVYASTKINTFFRFSFFHICLLRVNQFCFSIILLLLLCTSRYLLFIDYASGTKSEEKEKMMMVTFPSCPDFISSLKKNMLLIAISFPLARFLSSFIDKRWASKMLPTSTINTASNKIDRHSTTRASIYAYIRTFLYY